MKIVRVYFFPNWIYNDVSKAQKTCHPNFLHLQIGLCSANTYLMREVLIVVVLVICTSLKTLEWIVDSICIWSVLKNIYGIESKYLKYVTMAVLLYFDGTQIVNPRLRFFFCTVLLVRLSTHFWISKFKDVSTG